MSDYSSAIQLVEAMIISGSSTLDIACTNADAICANCNSLIVDTCMLNAKAANYGIVGKGGKSETTA